MVGCWRCCTANNLSLVIDCGFVKLRAINPKNGIETLMTVAVSKSSAEQRAGRAGRVKPGKCFRLYPESELEKLMPATVPEIQRTNLAPVILQLKALGVSNVAKFDYVSVSNRTGCKGQFWHHHEHLYNH